ncbi:MAG: response regulator [Deltaproteobacteria bacterium]|nr:response regulator [Deltaproteobacteria bacterium]
MTDQDDSELPSAKPASVASETPPTLEDLVCLQSTVEELRRERDALIRRVQAAESGSREKGQLTESRLREALAQVDALKRSAQAVRARAEGEVQSAARRAEQWQEILLQTRTAAEQLQGSNAELNAALETAQCRIADLETESAIHVAEIERQQEEQAAAAAAVAALTAQVAQVQQQLAERERSAEAAAAQLGEQQQTLAALQAQQAGAEETLRILHADRDQMQVALAQARQQLADETGARQALRQQLGQLDGDLAAACAREQGLAAALDELRQTHEQAQADTAARLLALSEQLSGEVQQRAEAAEQLASARAEHAAELSAWQETAAQREAELVAARDALAEQLAGETATFQQREQELSTALSALRQGREQAQAQAQALNEQLAVQAQQRADLAEQLERASAACAAEQQQRGEALAQLEAERAAHAAELSGWQETAAQREGELVAARDAVVKQLAGEVDAFRQREQELSAALAAAQQAQALASADGQARVQQLNDQLAAARQQSAGLAQQMEAAAAAHSAESKRWQETAAQREADLAAAHNQATRQLNAELDELRAREQELSTVLAEVRETHERTRAEAQVQLHSLNEQLVAEQHRRAQAAEQLEKTSAAQAAELSSWQETAAQREAELVAARDEAARQFEAQLAALRQREQELNTALEESHHTQAAARGDAAARLQSLEAQLAEAQQQRACLAEQLAAAATAQTAELNAWQETASQREAELVAARDEVARQLEEAQSEALTAREEVTTLGERLRGLEAELLAATQLRAEIEQELGALREERERERALFEAAARQREDEHRQALQAVQGALEGDRSALVDRLAAIEADRDARVRQCGDLERALTELRAAGAAEAEAERARVAELEAECAQREHVIKQLNRDAEALSQWYSAELQTATEATRTAREREAELVAVQEQLQRELDGIRADFATGQVNVEVAQVRQRTFEEQLSTRAAENEALSRQLTELQAVLGERTEALESVSAESERARRRYDEQLQAAAALAQEREKSLGATQAALATELAAARDELEKRRIAMEAVRVQVRALETQLAERDTVRTSLSNRIASLEEELRVRQARVAQLEAAASNGAGEGSRDEAAGQREAELVAAREEMAGQLAAEQARADDARAQAVALAERVRTLEADLGAAHTGLRSGELAWQAAQLQLQRELEAVRADAAQRSATIEAIQAELRALQATVPEGEVGQYRAALAAAERRNAELTHYLETVQEQTVSALQAQETMAGRIAELDGERRDLLLRVDQMTALTGQLERECERLRRPRPAGDESRKQKADITRLETKIAEIERQHGEAVQRHSAAVAGYMVELNQRNEALQARVQEVQRLSDELGLTRQACDDAIAQLAAMRVERAEIEQQLQELRALTAGSPRPKAEESAPAAAPRPAAAAPAATPRPGAPSRPAAAAAAAAAPAGAARRPITTSGPLTFVHLEENKAFRDSVREVLTRVPGSNYLNALDNKRPAGPGVQMLAVNLLNRAPDPLAAIQATADEEYGDVFAYCADGSCGFAFGPVDFFVPPIDPDSCVTRLLERRGAVQRLLAVSDNVEMTGALREVLARVRCSTSVAFDVRQAVDLLPMIKPDVVLVDFALPRGEGLRLISRLRSDAKLRDLPIAVLLPDATSMADFRQQALRAARELPMSASQLVQALGRHLGVPVPGAEAKSAKLAQTA